MHTVIYIYDSSNTTLYTLLLTSTIYTHSDVGNSVVKVPKISAQVEESLHHHIKQHLCEQTENIHKNPSMDCSAWHRATGCLGHEINFSRLRKSSRLECTTLQSGEGGRVGRGGTFLPAAAYQPDE